MIKRYNGTPEVWFNEEKNILVVRDSKILFEALYLNNNESYWKHHAFKESGSFDFFNGSKYLQDKGFELIERIT